jgi:hypothetical protein
VSIAGSALSIATRDGIISASHAHTRDIHSASLIVNGYLATIFVGLGLRKHCRAQGMRNLVDAFAITFFISFMFFLILSNPSLWQRDDWPQTNDISSQLVVR